ncbi:MAG TPA: Clp protease N-terminal domain-containing protein [Ktedonobacterales bacterium]|nr:Clp protease N-terminal domain-containing protein [Ktedonobacterales bacterium]
MFRKSSGGFSDKFEKFTERARLVLRLAQEEAQKLNHNYIGTEHLLLGLIDEGEGQAVKMLQALDIRPNKVRKSVMHIIGRGDRIVLGEVGLTPRAKKVMELAVDEARRLNHHYIGTEHLLLGLVREGEGIAAGVLESLGVNLDRARRVLVEPVGRETSSGTPPPTSSPPSPKNNVVTCRLDDAAVDALDALVEAGIRSTRSDAAAWLISAGIGAHRELFDRVNATVSEIRKLRLEARDIARQMTRDAAEQESPASDENTNTEGEAKDPEEPDDLNDLNRLDEPPPA